MEAYLELFVKETSWYNDIVLGSIFPENWWAPLPHFYRGWLRNCIGVTLLYLLSGSLWCIYNYYLKRDVYLPRDAIPSRKAILLQIGISMKSMPLYCALPSVSEYMIEHGWTKCFSRIGDVGWVAYIGYTVIYLVIVEFGMYWMHRVLHGIKPLNKYVHASHHNYNKLNKLSPFAGFATHPLDGILLGMPHVVALFLVPMHFTSHVALLFIEAVWTSNIHDCVHGRIWPVMGAGYHTIHHTASQHNYGHYTIWMDWMFGTLRHPVEEEPKKL